jgi:hypothetical protein
MCTPWILLMAFSLVGQTPQPSKDTVRMMKCRLNDRPHVLAVELSPRLWAAYDTKDCGLYGVWKGDVLCQASAGGPGAEPVCQMDGQVLLHRRTETPWRAVRGASNVTVETEWQEPEQAAGRVTLRYTLRLPDGERLRVREKLTLAARDKDVVEFRRVFELEDVPEGTLVWVDLPGRETPELTWTPGEHGWLTLEALGAEHERVLGWNGSGVHEVTGVWKLGRTEP